MTGPPNRAGRRRAWPKRRAWLDRIAGDCRLTSGAKAWLLLLAKRSDEAGKPVWGNQKKMGDQIGRCDRSVRRYRVEAEQLGYVDCYRAKPVRDPHTGRWSRRKSNSYYLRLPSRETAAQPAPRRRQRAPYCVVSAGRPRQPHLADSNERSSPDGVRQPPPHPPSVDERVSVPNVDHPENQSPPADAGALFAEIRATLRAQRGNLRR